MKGFVAEDEFKGQGGGCRVIEESCLRSAVFERRRDIVKPQPQMVLRCDAGRPLDLGFIAKERHDVARTRPFDRFV